MATTIWHESSELIPPAAAPPVEGVGSVAQRVRSMELVRRLATEIIDGNGGQLGSKLSDAEWNQMCRIAEVAESEESAVAEVIFQAYALKEVRENTPVPDPPLIPEAFGDPCRLNRPPRSEWVELTQYPRCIEPTPVPDEIGLAAQLASSPTTVGVDVLTVDVVTEWRPVAGGEETALTSALVPGVALPWPGESRQGPDAEGPQAAPSRVHPRSRKSVMDERHRQRWLTVASWVRNVGAIILLFVAWQLWGTGITQHHSQEALKSQFEAKVDHKTIKPAPGFTLIPSDTRIADPPEGMVMAHLQIPKIALDQFVVSGTAESDLAKGPGHYLGTAMPGQAGNVAIAGHRTTHGAPFNRLAELSIGDPIYLTAANGEELTYVVSAAPVAVSPRDVTVLNNFGDDRLTLTTCNPEYSAVQRLIVVAAYLPPGTSHPAPIAKGAGKPYVLAGSAFSGWNTSLLPWVLIALGALIALGLLYRRLANAFGREGRWLILMPVWLALLLALFESLTNFFPAAV